MSKFSKQSTVREDAGLEYQIQEQLRAYRQMRNIGNLQGMENTISGLKDILYPWIPKLQKDAYNDVKYDPKTLPEFYTHEDMEDLDKYGELEDDRTREMRREMKTENRRLFYETCDKRIEILMETFKQLDLGFKEQETATIDHEKDKKKVKQTTSAKKS